MILKPAWKLLNFHLPVFTEVLGYNRQVESTGEGRALRRRAELETALASEYRRRAAATLSGGDRSGKVEAVERGDADPWSIAVEIADA